MSPIRRFVAVLFLACTALSSAHAAELKHVVILRPDTNHPFWELFEAASNAACADLGCEVESIKSDWNQVTGITRLEERLKQQPKPDVVLFQSFKRNGPDVIKLAEKYQVNAFLINADIDPEQEVEIGKPREKYKFWLGRMLPDDAYGGKLMAQYLLAQAKKKGLAKDGKITLGAIEGNIADGASIERVKGLKAFVAEHPEVVLTQIVSGKWLTDLSAQMTQNLVQRYPATTVIWAVGDTTAMGVVQGIQKLGKTPGKDILTAGLDWSVDGLNAVKKGEIEATVGGHFMEGAWAVVIMHDYLKGKDFAKDEGVTLHSKMALIDKSNVDHYLATYGTNDFNGIDFKQYSKVLNPKVKRYDLDFSDALKQ